MNRWLCFVTALLTLPLPSAAAAVTSRDWKMPGDGLLTYDDVNRREWLDLSQTLLDNRVPGATREEKYQYVVGETAAGGRLAGFTVSDRASVAALAASAGIDTSVRPSAANVGPVTTLGELLSFTITPPSPGGNSGYVGFLSEFSDLPRPRRFGAIFITELRAQPPRAGLAITNNSDLLISPPPAVFIYRVIPEPSALWLSLPAAVAWVSVVRKLKRRRTRGISHGGWH